MSAMAVISRLTIFLAFFIVFFAALRTSFMDNTPYKQIFRAAFAALIS